MAQRLSDYPAAHQFFRCYWVETADLLYDRDVVRAAQDFTQLERQELARCLGMELRRIEDAGYITEQPSWNDDDYMRFWSEGGHRVLVKKDLERLLPFLSQWEETCSSLS